MVLKLSGLQDTRHNRGHVGITLATKHLQIYIMHREVWKKGEKRRVLRGEIRGVWGTMTVYH